MGSPSVGSQPGTHFGSYELRELIGMGGMGEVYRAYDTTRERMVALKLLRTDVAADPSYQDRFRRESRIAARLQEPHVIPVHDFGEIDGRLFIDMRLVEGSSVKDELRVKGPMPPARAVSIIGQVAAALDDAHANGLVHRDIKPENVLLTPTDFAYLVDFGIAYGGGEATVTKTGMLIGSCAYMATERLSGTAGGPPSDVYSLTCLLFECLTDRAPFQGKDLTQVMSAHMFSPPPRPSAARPEVGKAFDDVIAKGMAKDPRDRYGSAGELAAAASAALRGAQAPVAPPFTQPFAAPDPTGTYVGPAPAVLPKPSRFTKTQLALGVGTVAMLFALAAVLAAVVVTSGGGNSEPQSPLAVPPTATETYTTTETAAPSTTEETEQWSAPSSSSQPSTTATPTPTTSAPSPSTSTSAGPGSPGSGGAALAGMSGTDAQGFVGHSARCDAGSTPAAAIRTANSLAIVCETAPGSYYYRGERLSDGAQLQLPNAQPAGGGFDAINPADGARYQVRPNQLTISSSRGSETDPALEYGTD